MWKWLRKRHLPRTRDLLLEIIPKVELEPVLVPERYEIPKDFKPSEPKTIAVNGSKRTKAAERVIATEKSPPQKSGKKSGKTSSTAQAMAAKYEADLNALDEEKASNIINNA